MTSLSETESGVMGVYTISIGSNEKRKENMALARRRLKALFPGICFSAEEETEPVCLHRPSLFSNQVARFTSDSDAATVTSFLKAVEQEAGRTPEEKQQEIVRLDIDLLSCDDTLYKSEDLKRDYIRRGVNEIKAKSTSVVNRKLSNSK